MNQSNNKQQELLWLIIKIGTVAIAGAAIYLLGRLYLEAYYRYFGIAPGALSFSTEDYMFSCLNIVLMVVGVALWIWFTSKDVAQTQLWLFTESKRWRDILRASLGNVIFVFFVTFIVIAFNEGEVAGWIVSRVQGWVGLVAGFGIGMAFFEVCELIEYLSRTYKWSWSVKTYFKSTGFYILLTLILFASLPYLSGKLAQWAAFVEFQNFPQVKIICSDHPLELQTTEEDNNQGVTGKLLIVNNDMAYIFKSDLDEPHQALVEYPKSGKVYAIRFSDIEYMIQYPLNSSDNLTDKIGE